MIMIKMKKNNFTGTSEGKFYWILFVIEFIIRNYKYSECAVYIISYFLFVGVYILKLKSSLFLYV